MNYLSNKNAKDTYMAMLNNERKEVPKILRPYINIIRLVGMRYQYLEETKEFVPTINFYSYSPNFVNLLVTLAGIKKDTQVLDMYLDKYQNEGVQSRQSSETREGIDILVESRVPDFDFNTPVFKKLILVMNLLSKEAGNFWYVNNFVLYLTSKYNKEELNSDLLEMIQKNMITREDLEEFRSINPKLAEFYLGNYDYFKRHSYFSLNRKLSKNNN